MPTPDFEERPQDHALVTEIGDAAVALDAAGRVVAWNDAAARRAGILAGAVGRAVAEVIPAPHVAEATRLELADGGTILAWPSPRPIGADDVAREKAHILERLAPGVAHDLINQVGGIQGFLQVLEEADPRDRELLEATAIRAMDTVRAFQELVRSRITGPVSMPAAGLVAEALALCAYPLGDVAVEVDVPDTLPDVDGEPAHLRQALLAILVSAMDALGWPAAQGSIRLTARATDGRVEISVEDDGPAISGPAVDALFEATAGNVAGRDALDLAVARHLARLASGDCWYAPLPGGGNRFVLTLPAGAEPGSAGEPDRAGAAVAPHRAEPAEAPDGEPGGEPETARPPRGAVLVCDDEASVRSLVVRVLRRAGLETAEAATGEAALDIVATGAVRVVVADHRLGSMTGTELYTLAVAADPGLRGRFVLVSGDPDDTALADFAQANALQLVAKPFADLNALAALIGDLAS